MLFKKYPILLYCCFSAIVCFMMYHAMRFLQLVSFDRRGADILM
jgi:hypothetical protein